MFDPSIGVHGSGKKFYGLTDQGKTYIMKNVSKIILWWCLTFDSMYILVDAKDSNNHF